VSLESPDISEKNQSLWLLTVAPALWGLHLLLCYLTAAIWCGVLVGRDGSLSSVRFAIAIYTVLALIGIGITGLIGYRRHTYGNASPPHDFDSPQDRHRFLGLATLLLSALSAVATLYVALPALFIRSCY
jgi:hypothetical protein